MGLANVSIVGNVVRAPEHMQFASGKVKTTLVVAVNSPRKKDGTDSADFYKVETWGRLAELAATYLDKGNQVTATGRLMLERWTDDQGRERITPTVSAQQLALPPRRHKIEAAAKTSKSGEEGEDESDEPLDDDDEAAPERKPNDYERPVPNRKAKIRSSY